MAEIPFRILLDFRELNFKFYKFVWMSISPRDLVTIKDLKEAILKKFSFERTDLQLYLRDGLLPEDENISSILRENDNIRLFYTEPCAQGNSRADLNVTRSFSYEEMGESSNANQVKSPNEHKDHSDSSDHSNDQIESNKKRKRSFSNGTYLFRNNNTPENPVLIRTVSDNIENATNTDLNNFESNLPESCEIRKKLKYSHDISQNGLASENEIVYASDFIPMSEKNQIKINSCKKKKKHKHAKDTSENELDSHDNYLRRSEMNEIKTRSHTQKKKKKRKHSPDAFKMASLFESAVSFQDKAIVTNEKLNDSETRNEESELRESIFQTVINDPEVQPAPISLCTSSINTSSGIGYSLKTSQESNQKMSSEKNCSKHISDCKPVSKKDENNISVGQGNSCKKKKRKRHRKKKSLLISPEVDLSQSFGLEMTSPEKNGTLDSFFQTPDSSRPKTFYIERKNFSKTKGSFVEPFGNYLPSTSTPFSQTHSASPSKNVIFEMPSSSIASKDQSSSISLNTVLPANQKTMNENYLSACLSLSSVTKNKNTSVPNTLSTKISNCDKYADSEDVKKDVKLQTDELKTDLAESQVKKGRNVKIENVCKDKTASCERNEKFSNIEIKSRFLDPSFSYKGCPPLNSCPLVGTHIAYKMLELDASYSPVVSNYKEGIVKAVNSETDALEIELIEPEVKEGRTGKFENIYPDESPSCEVIRKVTLSWTSLIDPVRVIYMKQEKKYNPNTS